MSAFVLKIIALACMLIDHLGAVFPMYFPFIFRIIGRAAFPLYVYLIAEGCRHTRSMPKYLFRLGVFALISEIPYDLSVNHHFRYMPHVNFLTETNVFYTLFLGVLCVYGYQWLHPAHEGTNPTPFRLRCLLPVLPLLGLMFLAEWLQTDYGAKGVLFIFLMYALPQKTPRLWVMALYGCLLQYNAVIGLLASGLALLPPMQPFLATETGMRLLSYADIYSGLNGLWLLMGTMAAVPLVAYYNGKRGPGLRWFFYTAYPAHLLLYALIWLFMVRPALYG